MHDSSTTRDTPPDALHDTPRALDHPRPVKINREIRFAITAVVVLAAIILTIVAYRFYEYTPWTRDGRVRVYVVDTAPEVSGRVMEVPVNDNQFVHKGDLLYTIDPRDYIAALKRAQAALDSATSQLALQRQNSARRQILPNGDVSTEEKQTYVTNVDVSQADVESAEAALYKAKVDMERCEIRSPVNGWVTNLSVRVGNYANTGQRQMSIVDADSFWINGYFEETQLRNIRIGAQARAVLMGYPSLEVLGHVESLTRGIDDTDTAPNSEGLPQVSPIFTWVRLAQRIPVRIHIDKVPEQIQLAAGETCTIYISTN
jgi:multidrug resistance efflux pump